LSLPFFAGLPEIVPAAESARPGVVYQILAAHLPARGGGPNAKRRRIAPSPFRDHKFRLFNGQSS